MQTRSFNIGYPFLLFSAMEKISTSWFTTLAANPFIRPEKFTGMLDIGGKPRLLVTSLKESKVANNLPDSVVSSFTLFNTDYFPLSGLSYGIHF